MATGDDLLRVAATRVGQQYVLGAKVPKNDPNWLGPWDCAEFVSWSLYQASGILYGCDNNLNHPSTADSYTGFWRNDADKLGIKVSVDLAAKTVGAIVLRYPIYNPRTNGHIAISDGRGGTIEAKSRREGVVFDRIAGRRWDIGIFVPGIDYLTRGATVVATPPTLVFKLTKPLMRGTTVLEIQQRLLEKGYNPGNLDGIYGKDTIAAVIDFQRDSGLVADGEVGPQTALTLGIMLST